MSEAMPLTGGTALELPASAPLIRITAGVGSAGQKTWNIRRPVTLIGTCRPAHIVLHDKDVSKAHCVVVNTGTDVLLKDLHTSHGTHCNKERVDLVSLKDGDVVTVGSTRIQVAIRVPENGSDDSGCGMEYVDPCKYPQPVILSLDHVDQQWKVEDAVVLIGRHADAEIRVDHQDVSTRHAILFKFVNGAAVFDMGTQGNGVVVNGQRCPISTLQKGDRIAIDPVAISVESEGSVDLGDTGGEGRSGSAKDNLSANVDDVSSALGEESAQGTPQQVEETPAGPSQVTSPLIAVSDSLQAMDLGGDSNATLSKIESELGSLQKNISESWDRLNSRESQLLADATRLDKQEKSLSEREAELEVKDAALRGQLHDLTRFHEQIVERERELAVQLAKIQEAQDQAAKTAADLAQREAEVSRRVDELRNREHVVAQRWTRLQTAKCTHCGKPVRTGTPGTWTK
ncbi:MAG: FHA domain-containing protein [Phycisphaerales bacterium]|nr:MAG: FHA domain-containing protein [Phycisphaerales bacterium]